MNYQAIRDRTILAAGFDAIPIQVRKDLFDVSWAVCGNNEAEVTRAYHEAVQAYLAKTSQENLLTDGQLASLGKAAAPPPPPPPPASVPPPLPSITLDLGMMLVVVDALQVAAEPLPRPYVYSAKTRAGVLMEVLKQLRVIDLAVMVTSSAPKEPAGG